MQIQGLGHLADADSGDGYKYAACRFLKSLYRLGDPRPGAADPLKWSQFNRLGDRLKCKDDFLDFIRRLYGLEDPRDGGTAQ